MVRADVDCYRRDLLTAAPTVTAWLAVPVWMNPAVAWSIAATQGARP